MIWRSAVALLFVGVLNGTTFDYSVSCPAVTIGPDTIPAYSNSGTLSLTPNVLLIPSDLHVLHLQMAPIGTNPTSTFTGTLSCQFTFNGQTITANRSVTMTVNFLIPSGEQHQYAFQPFSVTASAGAAGNLKIAEAALGFNFLLQAVASDFQTTLLLAPAQPAPTPAPSSLILLFTGLTAVGVYQLARKRLNTSG
jgi:hypothetical protein